MTLEFAGKQTVWYESVAGFQEVTFEISDLVVRLPPGLKPCDSWRLYQQSHLERKYTILFPENQVRICLLRLWSSSQGSAFAIINQGRIDIPVCRQGAPQLCCG